MERVFLANRANGKEATTLYMLYAQAADEKPLNFDIYGFRIRYVPERTCSITPNGYGNGVCSNCKEELEIYDGWSPFDNEFSNAYCPNCGAKVVE